MYRMNISTSLDDNYVKYAYVLLYSLFENNPDAEVYVYLLQSGLSEESILNLTELCEKNHNHLELLTIDADDMDKRLLQTDNWTMEACYRLKLFDLLPQDVERVLYLDADMIVNRSLRDLYQVDMGEKKVGAVRDLKPFDKEIERKVNALRDSRISELFEENSYFNSGMLLFDVKRMREYTYEKYMDEAEKIGFRLYAPDQDLLNLVHHEEVLWINENEYNVFPAIKIEEGYGYSELKDQVAIFHFTGKKPWTGGNHIHFDTEKIWWDYALKTCYRDVFLEEFVLNSLEDMSMREYVRDLIRENLQLKTDLQAVAESMQKLMSRFDNN